jgi:hypothetical protein
VEKLELVLPKRRSPKRRSPKRRNLKSVCVRDP